MMRKNVRIIIGLLIVISALGFTSCKKDRAFTEDVTGTNKEETVRNFNLADFLIDDENKIYSFDKLLDEGESITEAGFYDENTIIMSEAKIEDGETRLLIKTVSLIDGEKKEQMAIESQSAADGRNYGKRRFQIKSYNPLIVWDCSRNEYYLFNNDLDDYLIVRFSDDTVLNSAYSVYDNSFYYVNAMSELYKCHVDKEFKGREVFLVNNEKAELKAKPDYNWTGSSISKISRDGRKLLINSYDAIANKSINLCYDLSKGSYTDIYINDFDNYYNFCDLGYSYGLKYEFCEDEGGEGSLYGNSYNYVFNDFANGRKYRLENIKNNDNEYIFLQSSDGSFERPGCILFVQQEFSKEAVEDIGIESSMAEPEATKLIMWKYEDMDKFESCERPAQERSERHEFVKYNDLDEIVTSIEDKYGIDLFIGENARYFNGYDIEIVEDSYIIRRALEVIDNTLSVYPDGFINEMNMKSGSRLKLYLTGEMKAKMIDIDYENPAGVTSNNTIALNINYLDSLCGNLFHEMSHATDNSIQTGIMEDINNKWITYNPEGFSYYNSYTTKDVDFTYTCFSDDYFESGDTDNIYFYDDYAKRFQTEDRARIFEYLLADEESERLFKSSHIKGKLKLYIDMLEQEFDSVDKESIFYKQYEKMFGQE